MTSSQQPYVSCIRSFGRPILPPLMTEEKRRVMRDFKAVACEREASREKRMEAFRNENAQRGAGNSPKGSSFATAVHKELGTTPVAMSGVILCKGFRWVPSPSGSTPDTASSATLVPSSSESDHDDPHDKTFDSCDAPSGRDCVSSTCAEVFVADSRHPETQPVADDKEPVDEDETSRPPLLRSLSFTVEKPSLALLLWGSKDHHTAQRADDNRQEANYTGKSFSSTATPQKTESNDSLSGTSPTSTELSSSQPSLVSSKADGEDFGADGNIDGGADDVFADADTDLKADDASTHGDSKVASDGPKPSDVKTASETFVVPNGVGDELSTSTATHRVVPLKRGETFLRSPRRKDESLSKSAGGDRRSFTSTGSVESSAAESSALSLSQLSSSNGAERRQDAEDADQESDIETSSDSSDDSFRSTKGLDFMEEMLAEHNKAMGDLSRNLALEFVRDGSTLLPSLSLNGGGGRESLENPDTSTESRTAPLSDDSQSDAEQSEDTSIAQLQRSDIAPVETGGSSLDLLSQTKQTLHPRWRRSFARLTAMVRGHLTRRLMKTDRVQTIIQTIKDTLECALALHQEPHIKCGTITAQDLELHQRLITQVTFFR
ncbi:unnamed protein product [Ixodes hexagonus]